MQLIRILMVSVVLDCCSVDGLSEALAYTKSIIQHIEQSQTGIFKCIFINICNEPFHDDDSIYLMQSGSNVISQYVISSTTQLLFHNALGLPKQPSLLVALITSEKLLNHSIESTQEIFYLFDSNMRIMILTNLTDWNNVNIINSILTRLRYNYVVYIGTNEPSKVVRFDFTGEISTVLDRLPHPAKLFRNAVRNMEGSAFQFATLCRIASMGNNWMIAVAQMINATVSRVNMPCSLEAQAGILMAFQLDIDITLSKMAIQRFPSACHRWISDVMPDTSVILIPKGRPLNMVETFGTPFTGEAWFVLLILLILLEVVGLAQPTLFKDDPILLLLCGYERVDLHNSKGYQKLVYLPLMVFFFLMSNAYGTKIISILINKPSVPDITTVGQLMDSGIKVKVSAKNYPHLLKDTGWLHLLVNSSDDALHLDGSHAYLGYNSRQAKFLLNLPTSYDFDLQRPKYTILEEHQELSLMWYMVGPRTPLRELFFFTQKALFECGILHHWYHELYSGILSEQQATFRDQMSSYVEGWLRFDDLIPAWFALCLGHMLSAMLFVGEMISSNIFRAVRKLIEMYKKLMNLKAALKCKSIVKRPLRIKIGR